MKVTCASCFKVLRVEDWLADNVARCPKCNEVIRIPPVGSPDGANAVVLTSDEASDLLRRRAESGQIPKLAQPAKSGGRPRGPKTEPLPAFLRQAAPAIHEEPERHKTRPLPRPPGRPSPAFTPGIPSAPVRPPDLDAFDELAAAAAEPVARRKRPAALALAPIAFVLGLAAGAAIGFWVGRSTAAPAPGRNGTEVSSEQPRPPAPESFPIRDTTLAQTPPLAPPVRPGPTVPLVEVRTPPLASQPQSQPVAAAPAPPPLPIKRPGWPTSQPDSPLAKVNSKVIATRRVAAIPDTYPVNNLYYPAPPRQVYLQVAFKVAWQGKEPVKFKLGQPPADCWLVCNDGQTFEPIGQPRKSLPAENVNPLAVTDAVVSLDASNPSADISVVFLVPEPLPPARIMLTGSEYADLPPAPIADADPLGHRAIDGKWDSVPVQLFANSYPDDQPIMAALAKADRPHTLSISKDGNGYKLAVEKCRITGTLTPRAERGYFDAALTMGDKQAAATVRVFDGGRVLVIYLGPGKFMQAAYQLSEQSFFGL